MDAKERVAHFRKLADEYPAGSTVRALLHHAVNEIERTANEVPDDVRRLVIAARVVAFEDQGREALKELDKASEAFADRVPWDDAPAKKSVG